MSGYRGDRLYPGEQAQLSAAAATNAVASIQAGHPFSLLLTEDDRQRVVDLDALMDTIADASTRFTRATNPLRARLTLERLLLQVISGPVEPIMHDPAAVIRRIAERRADETRVILVIERAETLHPEVVRFFGSTAAMFPDATPRLQILFVGRPEFQAMLDNPEAGFDEQTAMLEAYRPREAEPAFALPMQGMAQAMPQQPLPFYDTSVRAQFLEAWRSGLTTQIGIVGGTLVGTGAVVFAVLFALTGPASVVTIDTSTSLDGPEAADVNPDPPALQPGPPVDAETARLRTEFQTYLTASGKDVAHASATQRRALYQEFMLWRARTGGAGPVPLPLPPTPPPLATAAPLPPVR